MEKPEKYQRQRARKRIYVDSNHGENSGKERSDSQEYNNITRPGPFKCPGCDAVTFSNRRALDLHMRKIHKVLLNIQKFDAFLFQAGIVECDECGRKVLDLKRHKEILHKYEIWAFGSWPSF